LPPGGKKHAPGGENAFESMIAGGTWQTPGAPFVNRLRNVIAGYFEIDLADIGDGSE
jgi:hypothetical protein